MKMATARRPDYIRFGSASECVLACKWCCVLPFGVVLSSLHDGSSATFGGRAHQDLTGGMSHHDYIPRRSTEGSSRRWAIA